MNKADIVTVLWFVSKFPDQDSAVFYKENNISTYIYTDMYL